MRRLIPPAVALAACVGLTVLVVERRAAAGPPPVGVNLSGVADYSTDLVFVDAFKSSRPWVGQAEGKKWGEGGPLDLTQDGWVKKLDAGKSAETLMFTELKGHHPDGDYVCLYDGRGEVEIGGAAKAVEAKPGRIAVRVDAAKGTVSLRIKKTDPADPIRNVRFLLPGYEKTSAEDPFHPDFVKRLDGFAVLRFMDWQGTNGSKQATWADRSTPSRQTQAGAAGVCLEYQILLANRLKSDPWFCLPHRADDDYVRNFATLVKERLDKGRMVYVEYSNETWNGGFEQAKYCADKGTELGMSKNPYEAQLRYSSRRSVEVFKIFEAVLGKERLVRVLAAQAVNPWSGTTVMDWQDAFKSADAIAIAPYFGHAFGDPKTADKVAKMSVADLLNGCRAAVAENRKHVETYAKEAKARGLKLLAYESGQHLAGYGGAENDDRLTKLFLAANRDPKMKDVYLDDMKMWRDAGGGAFVTFATCGGYSKWGSWGLIEFNDQDEKTAPKLLAVREFLKGSR